MMGDGLVSEKLIKWLEGRSWLSLQTFHTSTEAFATRFNGLSKGPSTGKRKDTLDHLLMVWMTKIMHVNIQIF